MISRVQRYLKKFLMHPRFPFLIALVAFAEMFLVVIPPDLLLVADSVASPRRRPLSVFLATLGSSLGALALVLVLREGSSALLTNTAGAGQPGWISSLEIFFQEHGAVSLFLGAILPIPLQPFLAGALLARFGLLSLYLVVFAGRLVKYSALATLAQIITRRLSARVAEISE